MGYKKIAKKTKEVWEAHNVDSHVLCEIFWNKALNPFKGFLRISFLRFHRRQLHFLQFFKGGVRRSYGGTRSMGFKRGSWIVNRKYGIGYVSGARLGYITIKDIFSRKRLTECGKINETKFLTFSSWLAYLMNPMGEIIHAK